MPCSQKIAQPVTKGASADKLGLEKSGEAHVKPHYHHGSLREALIETAFEIIRAHGVDAFSMSAACETHGVTGPAAYRHFKTREALLGEVAARGFEALTIALEAARAPIPLDAPVERLVAIGQAYVGFVGAEPHLFHLMWGGARDPEAHPKPHEAGKRCYDVLLDTIREVQAAEDLGHYDVRALALPLWSMVHGMASLRLANRTAVAGQQDLNAAIALATRSCVLGLKVGPKPSEPL